MEDSLRRTEAASSARAARLATARDRKLLLGYGRVVRGSGDVGEERRGEEMRGGRRSAGWEGSTSIVAACFAV